MLSRRAPNFQRQKVMCAALHGGVLSRHISFKLRGVCAVFSRPLHPLAAFTPLAVRTGRAGCRKVSEIADTIWTQGVGVSAVKALVQLPRAKAGFDLSATGRQGLAQALAHPTYLKEAFARQVKAFAGEDTFNAFRAEIMGRPDLRRCRSPACSSHPSMKPRPTPSLRS